METISSLTALDFFVVAALLVLMVSIGYLTGGKKTNTQDFFLARGRIPWWAACLSFVATEVSAVTLIAVPATAYMENWQYAQFFIGSFAARAIIAFLFIPAFYQYHCTTIYEFLKHRFGNATQYSATVFFFITRLLGSGVRLMAASLAVSVLMGWSIGAAIALFTVVSIAYVIYGGMESVVWTGVLQALVFIAAGLATIAFIVSQIPGGLEVLIQTAKAGGKLNVWNWGPSFHEPHYLASFLKDPNIIWIAILNGLFGSMAAFGTDQELMQRLLTVETRKKSQLTMILTPFGSLFVLMIFLSVGASLYSYYATHTGAALPAKLDSIFPHFVSTVMPAGLRGLVLAAIVMASIDSPLASLTTSFVTDIYRPLVNPNASEEHLMRLSRKSIGVFAVILGLIAFGFSFFQNILWLAFKIGGVTFGSLLGVFLFGLLTKRLANRANVAAMVTMAVVNATLLILSELKVIHLGWTWLVIVGTIGTFLLGFFLAPLLDKKSS